MDTQPLPIPRLRLTRHSTSPPQPVAGPSRLSSKPPVVLNSDDEDDPVAQSTPKVSAIAALPHVQITSLQADTPAARLRALLSRVPNHSTTTVTVPPAPASPSEVESDFDVPQSALATPSIARESLKDLFSRALRDTPQKARLRRNSIDASEVEASPRVEKERAKNKGKRKSLSDEELDKPSRSSQRSETSFRSSQAATFNLLRERLTNSLINMDDSPPSSPHEHDSIDTEKFTRDLNFSQSTPPAATSTPQRSVMMTSRSQLESNLLDQDSEMQREMRGGDSYDDSGPSQRPLSFPPFHNVNAQSARRPSHVKSHSHDSTHGRQQQTSPREDIHSRSSSRASSSHSVENKTDKDREREREWNRPQLKTPHKLTHRHSHGASSRSVSPMLGQSHTLSRKGSAVSLRSLDDGGSTRTSSIGSQADYHERVDDLERERNIEREREWNKRHSNVVRPVSSLGLHSERTRTHSHAIRPGSAQSHVRTDHDGFRGRLSVSPSPGDSPDSSLASRESVREQSEETRHELEHQLERNWNSPHPKQLQPLTSRSSLSSHLHSRSHSPTHGRVRAESLKTSAESPNHYTKSAPRPSTIHPSTNMNESTSHDVSLTNTGRRTSPSLHRPMSHHARTNTPVPPPASPPPAHDNKSQGSVRHGWQFPRSRTPLPPIEADQDSHSRARTLSSPTPSSRPPSRVTGSSRISHIPVKSPKKSHESPSTLMSMSAELNSRSSDSKRGHKRSTTELSEAIGKIPTDINQSIPSIPDIPSDSNSGSDSAPVDDYMQTSRTPTSESDQEVHERISTPTIGPLDTPRAASMILHNNNDEFRLQKALAPPAITEERSQLPSPPSETPPSPPQPTSSILSTPVRHPSSTSRAKFETPSPPHGLPELPGPPSSDDEVGAIPLTFNGDANDLTVAKTPRPPGAWASTPTFRPSSRNTLAMANSLPDDSESSDYDIGLATPVASLSKATSVPPQTPAPPGGWVSTPHRKSILKVRFDVEPSENSVSESISEPSMYLPSDLKEPAGTSQMNGDVTPFQEVNAKDIVRAQTPEPHTAIVPVSPRSPRKSPSIRVLDAFGRERRSDGGGKQKDPDTTESRSKSTIRVLDAMGREVEEAETGDKSKGEEDVPLKHNEAVARVRKGIADLAEGLNDADRSIDDPLDEQYLNRLDVVSRTARDTRHKISRTLQETEDNLRSKFGSLKSSIKKSSFLPTIYMDRRRPWLSWLFWGVVVFQILLIILMYRISIFRAKDMFLTTYYDPFYPDLHLYTTKPDTHYHSVTSSVSSSRSPWTLLSTLDTIQREGWKTAVVDMWDTFAVVIDSWQRRAWEAWGTGDHTKSISWPPT